MGREYNGHPSWNAWNVSLWIGNDEGLYRFALDCLKRAGGNVARAARFFSQGCGERTPDGARYSQRSIRHALTGLE